MDLFTSDNNGDVCGSVFYKSIYFQEINSAIWA